MGPKRLVLFAEGRGDVKAVHTLVTRVLRGMNPSPFDVLFPDEDVFRVNGIENFTGRLQEQWEKKLRAASLRRNLGAVLLILDGDREIVEGQPFCAARLAKTLALRARHAGAGSTFSLACAFACMEYESWIIGGIESLVGRRLPDGREGIRPGTLPHPDPENKRGAKEWLAKVKAGGYKPTADQLPLTEMIELSAIRNANLRSFERLETALAELVNAVRQREHISTPC